MLDAYLQSAFQTVLLVTAVPLLATAMSGLVVSVLQACTQVQEQTTAFIVKLLTFAAVLALAGRWLSLQLLVYLQETLGSVALLGQG